MRLPWEICVKIMVFLGPAFFPCARLWQLRSWAWLEASQRYLQDRWGGFHGRARTWVPRPTPKQKWEWESWGGGLSTEEYEEGCRLRGVSPGPLPRLLE